jgi:hypothetical protein
LATAASVSILAGIFQLGERRLNLGECLGGELVEAHPGRDLDARLRLEFGEVRLQLGAPLRRLGEALGLGGVDLRQRRGRFGVGLALSLVDLRDLLGVGSVTLRRRRRDVGLLLGELARGLGDRRGRFGLRLGHVPLRDGYLVVEVADLARVVAVSGEDVALPCERREASLRAGGVLGFLGLHLGDAPGGLLDGLGA